MPMMDVECILATDLIAELDRQGVRGAVVEFGVFEGYWMEKLIEIVEAAGSRRQVLGFDSFEGLPATGPYDQNCWHEGQYKASYDQVYTRLRVEERQDVKLIRGWFKDTLPLAEAQAIEEICYARIDCDLYEPTVSLLTYLQSRLTHNSVLVLDDWTFTLDKGETRAFYEWMDTQYVKDNLSFEFICFHGINHFYLRVLRKK